MVGHPNAASRSLRGGRLLVVLFLVALFLMATTLSLWAPAAQAAGEEVTYEPEEVSFVSLLNWYRFSNNLEPLMVSNPISLACERHSSDMQKYDFFGHYTGYTLKGNVKVWGVPPYSDWFPAESAPWNRMWLSGYSVYPYTTTPPYATWAAENIAAGQPTALDVFNAWKLSPDHNSTMLSASAKVMGVSLVYVDEPAPCPPNYDYYWTTDFGNYVDSTAHWIGNVPFQQTDPKITYSGAWVHHATSPAFGGTFHYSGTRGAIATITFTGTSIELFGLKGPDWGKAKVTLDGAVDYVNFYSPGYAYRQSVYFKSGLPDTAHTLTLECLGEKDTASSGYLVDIDALRIMGTLTQAPTPPAPTLYQQTASEIAFAPGVWVHHATGPASGGTFHYTSTAGAKVNVSFNGTAVELLALTGPDWGKATVILDEGSGGEETREASCYSPGYIFQRSVYFKGGLADTTHTLTIECMGQGLVNLDAVLVTGTPARLNQATAPLPPPTPPTPTRFEQTASEIAFAPGVWVHHATGPASGGTFHYTGTAGAKVNISFNGTAVELLALTGPDWGTASVTLDGVPQPESVSFYSGGYIFQRSVYKITDLSEGDHNLTIECLGTGKVNLDAVLVTGTPGTLVQATAPLAPPTPPAPTLFQQDNANIKYSGGWTFHPTSPASGGSFNYTSLTDAAVAISFTGTAVELYALTGPDWGKATVILDEGSGGEETGEASCYSPGYIFQRSVYKKTGLTDGPHTLLIKCQGLGKVNLDAVAVTGTPGTLTEATTPPTPPMPPTPTLYQQNDPKITYAGDWIFNHVTSPASGGSFHYTSAAGASATLSFTGNTIQLLALTGPDWGTATITVDKGTAAEDPLEVSFYSPGYIFQRSVYQKAVTEGTHTLTIECLGTAKIGIDAFWITGTLD